MQQFVKRQYSGSNTLAINLSLLLMAILGIIQLTLSLSIAVVEIDSTSSGTFKIYWSEKQESYSEIKSKTAKLNPGHNILFFTLLSRNHVDKVTINPLNTPGQVKLNNMVFRVLGYDQVIHNSLEHFQKFRVLQSFSHFEPGQSSLLLETADGQSQFEVAVIHPESNRNSVRYIDWINLKLIFILIAVLFTASHFCSASVIYGAMLLVFLLINVGSFDFKHSVISIDMKSDVNDQLAVYWGGKSRMYEETRVSRLKTSAEYAVYRLPMDSLQTIDFLRIDPLEKAGQVFIKQITLSQLGFNALVINAGNKFKGIDFDKNRNLHIEGPYLVFSSTNSDDFFEIGLDKLSYQSNTLFLFCGIALLILATVNFIYYFQRYYELKYKAV